MWFRFSDIYRQYTIFGENGQLNSLPKSHHMLHSKTYKRYADPAAKTCEDWFRACFYKVNDICIQPDRRLAMTIKNLLSSLSGPVTAAGRWNIVVTTDARMKKSTKNGKDFLKLKEEPSSFFSFFSR